MAVGGFDLAFINEGQEDTDFGARLMYFLSGAYVVPAAAATHFGAATNFDNASGRQVEIRPSRADERHRERTTMLVNGGLAYWKSPDWEQFCRGETTSSAVVIHPPATTKALQGLGGRGPPKARPVAKPGA